MKKLAEIEINLKPSQIIKMAESWKREAEYYVNPKDAPNFIMSQLSDKVVIVWHPEWDEDGKLTNY